MRRRRKTNPLSFWSRVLGTRRGARPAPTMRVFSLRHAALLGGGMQEVILRRIGTLPYLSGGLVVCSLLLGGGARTGFMSDALLQLVALPILVVALRRDRRDRFFITAKWESRFCLAAAALPLAQLAPLPPAVWTLLPRSGVLAEAFEFVGGGLPWMSISVSPRETWLCLLSALPPITMFVCVVQLDRRERRDLTLLLLGCGVVSVVLGLMQIRGGPQSSLRFFAVTNPSEAVGFFANRNHYSALLYILVLFASAWVIELSMSIDRIFSTRSKKGGSELNDFTLAVIFFVIVVGFIGAQAMARSRAGLGLTMIALFGAFAMAGPRRRWTCEVTNTKLLIGALAVGIALTLQFALLRIQGRFASDPLEDLRWPFAWTTIEAATAYTPFGSGLGSFTRVYDMFEKPANLLVNGYVNHAHNDILELWLETGLGGVALMAAFAGWFVARARAVWARASKEERPIDTLLPRAATIAIGLLIIHSFVDYPLRTSAMMTVFAFACALLTEIPAGAGEGRKRCAGQSGLADVDASSEVARDDVAGETGGMNWWKRQG
jgi:O-antigen ligase